MRSPRQRPASDLSRSSTELDANRTMIAVVEMSVDAFRKKLEERRFSATEIATALEVLEEMDVSFASSR